MSSNDLTDAAGPRAPLALPRPLGGRPVAELSDEEFAMLKLSEEIAPDAPTPEAGGFQLRRVGELEVRPPSWLVRDLLEADSLALFFGDPAAGKSFFALDLAACISTGAAFHGRPIARPGAVVYIAGEGHNGLARRLRAWSIARGVDLNTAPFSVSTLPAALCDAGTMAEVSKVVARSVREIGAPRLIILDTWSRNLGGDENASADAAIAIAAMDRLRAPWKSAGLVVHHAGHAEKNRARGSTVLRGAVDLELKVERGRDGIIRIETTKAKDIAPPPPMAFSLRDIDLGILDEEGRPVSSAVLEEEDFQPEEAPKAPSGKKQKAALAVLVAELEQRRKNVRASGRDSSEARVTIDEWRALCSEADIDRRRFSDAKSSLQASGAIDLQGEFVYVVSLSGNDSRPVLRPESVRPSAPYRGGGHGRTIAKGEEQKSGEMRTENGQETDKRDFRHGAGISRHDAGQNAGEKADELDIF